VRATESSGLIAARLVCGRINQNPARKIPYAASSPNPIDATPAQINVIKSAIPYPNSRFSICAVLASRFSAARFRRLSQNNSFITLNICLQTEYLAHFRAPSLHTQTILDLSRFEFIPPVSRSPMHARPGQR
jgi:hypothetical protein